MMDGCAVSKLCSGNPIELRVEFEGFIEYQPTFAFMRLSKAHEDEQLKFTCTSRSPRMV